MSISVRLCAAALAALATVAPAAAVRTTVTLSPATRYQTFRGWEVAVLPTVRDYFAGMPVFDEAFRLAATDLGITRVKLGVFSGTEGVRGPSAQYIAGTLSEREYLKSHAYSITNDNRDSRKVNPDGFDFTILDWQMSNMFVPFARHVEAAGETPRLIYGYVDYGVSTFGHYAHPDEYAELLSVSFAHLQSTYGRVPDEVDVINEPDLTRGWTGDDIGKATFAAGRRLEVEGYRPAFIGPSPKDRGLALPLLADMLRTKGVEKYLKQISYHCYADSGKNTLARLGEVVSRTYLESGMGECWGENNDAKALMADLKLARVSAWQQATFNGPNGLYLLDPDARTVTLRPKTRLLRQFYKYIRPGAVRIGVETTDASMDPVAFIAPDGHVVVVAVATAAGEADIVGLPAGAYDLSYTTAAAFDVHAPVIELAAGAPLTASIPGPGVLTIRGQKAD